jgi:DNA mismatch repair protein MutS2
VNLAASFAQTPTGREKVGGLFPFFDPDSIVNALGETAEAGVLLAKLGRLPLRGVEDPKPPLERLAAAGGLCFDEEIRPLVAVARAADKTRRLLSDATGLRLLSRHLTAIPDLGEIARRASLLFEPDGTLADRASPKLAELRGKLRRQRQRLYDIARSWLERNGTSEDTVVLREGRYCVPVAAGAASRVPGIIHDRSGSGQTIFLEPSQMTEGNNELSLLASDLRREEERIRREFGNAILARSADIENAAEILAHLDSVEARAIFSRETDGVLPEFSSDGRWELLGARHPLLDSRLAAAREAVFGEERRDRDVVPLDVELSEDKRWLLLSGPNSGGKTVVLKTLGLFSRMAQSGLPVPARRALLPVFRSFSCLVGDEQAILSDLSTFSSSMRRLAEIVRLAEPGTLALLDELGGGTDPEEGTAIAIASLETLLARGARVVVTTHLAAVKEFAASRGDAQVSAMEFDEETGRPTYRLRPGFLGRSRALATAREQGLPKETLDRATEILGAAWVRRERLETEAEEALARVRERERELTQALEQNRTLARRLEEDSAELASRRREVLSKGKESLDRARHAFRAAAAEAIAKIQEEKMTAAAASGVLAQVEEIRKQDPLLREAEMEAAEESRALRSGDSVRLRGGSAPAEIEEIQGARARILANGKRLWVPLSDLVAAGTAAKNTAGKAARNAAGKSPGQISFREAEPSPAPREVNVIGKTVEDAITEVDRAIDQTLSAGAETLRVVHGHGTGRLRAGLREYFRTHSAISSFRGAEPNEGGNGATVVVLK